MAKKFSKSNHYVENYKENEPFHVGACFPVDFSNSSYRRLTVDEPGPRCIAAADCCGCACPCPAAWPPTCSSAMFIACVMAFITISPSGIRYIHCHNRDTNPVRICQNLRLWNNFSFH